ncbi:MAG: hypothetical protein BGP16_07935 [Sphingobium sp. 66-54]|nr:MAG: hypothetical protein BGP16_07935 [Sphingobium sp. 66-54]
MKTSLMAIGALAALAIPAALAARSTPLDLDALHSDVVHDAARRTIVATGKTGQPLVVLLRIAKGSELPPHGEAGGVRLLTVLSGTLSWGDGTQVDRAAERRFGPGSVIVVPARGGAHWAAARGGDVLLQVVMIGDGALAPEVAAQAAR